MVSGVKLLFISTVDAGIERRGAGRDLREDQPRVVVQLALGEEQGLRSGAPRERPTGLGTVHDVPPVRAREDRCA